MAATIGKFGLSEGVSTAVVTVVTVVTEDNRSLTFCYVRDQLSAIQADAGDWSDKTSFPASPLSAAEF